jgi:hypothetical protein
MMVNQRGLGTKTFSCSIFLLASRGYGLVEDAKKLGCLGDSAGDGR